MAVTPLLDHGPGPKSQASQRGRGGRPPPLRQVLVAHTDCTGTASLSGAAALCGRGRHSPGLGASLRDCGALREPRSPCRVSAAQPQGQDVSRKFRRQGASVEQQPLTHRHLLNTIQADNTLFSPEAGSRLSGDPITFSRLLLWKQCNWSVSVQEA